MTASLFFDTETTGMALWKAPAIHPGQPKIVQLAAILRDDETRRDMASLNIIIEPNGWTIDPGAAAVHGISMETAQKFGVDHNRAVDLFVDMIDKADTLVAHNIKFDDLVLRHALYTYSMGQESETTAAEIYGALIAKRDRLKERCTMLSAVNVVRILHEKPRHPTDYKWPKLSECVRYFFDEDLQGAHDALVDVRACIRVHDALQDLRAFDDQKGN